jgi:N-acetylglucosaminyldiphosphoundecaprenol N-acetyl-beta-D-mannosaminyltransferase
MNSNASTPHLPTARLLGFDLLATRTGDFLDSVLEAAAARERPLTIGYLNAAQVNLAFDDPEQARRLAALDWLYADGQAVVWASRWAGGREDDARKGGLPERINAGDFTRELMKGLARRDLSVALVGGRPGEAELAAERFRRWAPGLEIAFWHHGFFSEAEAPAVRERLETADPDLVLLGMGAPRQERWALAWAAGPGRPRAWWCVGALLEYYAGTRWRAPGWMRRAGLEWAVRLVLEPRRLWRRYVIGNPRFAWRVLRGRPPTGLGAPARPGRD